MQHCAGVSSVFSEASLLNVYHGLDTPSIIALAFVRGKVFGCFSSAAIF